MLIELVAQTGMCINGFSGPGLGPNAHLVQIVTWLPKYFTGTGTRCAAHVDATDGQLGWAHLWGLVRYVCLGGGGGLCVTVFTGVGGATSGAAEATGHSSRGSSLVYWYWYWYWYW